MNGPLFRHASAVIEERRDTEVVVFMHVTALGRAISALDARSYVVAQSWANLVMVTVLLPKTFILVSEIMVVKLPKIRKNPCNPYIYTSSVLNCGDHRVTV